MRSTPTDTQATQYCDSDDDYYYYYYSYDYYYYYYYYYLRRRPPHVTYGVLASVSFLLPALSSPFRPFSLRLAWLGFLPLGRGAPCGFPVCSPLSGPS